VAARRPDVFLSISATTRAPRPGERHGVDYIFLSPEEFDDLERSDAFLETATVYGERYGTLRSTVEQALHDGKIVLLEIDVQGARSVRAAVPRAVLVFIEPPSFDALRARLTGRQTEDPEVLDLRLRHSLHELEAASEFDDRIVNAELSGAIDELVRILDAVHEESPSPGSEGDHP
jgi:guanylate kinase